jgi:hypothetical protein
MAARRISSLLSRSLSASASFLLSRGTEKNRTYFISVLFFFHGLDDDILLQSFFFFF